MHQIDLKPCTANRVIWKLSIENRHTWKIGNIVYQEYTFHVSQEEIIKHWHRGANDALEAALLLENNGKYALALFHCHLAVEKALKAVYIFEHDKNPPASHDLTFLAEQLSSHWSEQEEDILDDLSGYSTAARYEDQRWHEQKATKENVQEWLKKVAVLLKKLHSSLQS